MPKLQWYAADPSPAALVLSALPFQACMTYCLRLSLRLSPSTSSLAALLLQLHQHSAQSRHSYTSANLLCVVEQNLLPAAALAAFLVANQLPHICCAVMQGSMTKEQKDAGLASVYKRDDGKKRKETDARMREAAFVPDAYGECYPGYHELGTAVVDDDEADFTAMDSKVSFFLPSYCSHFLG